MRSLLRYAAQAVLYAAFAVVIAVFSQAPAYQHMAPELALVKLSFEHAGERVEECKRRTQEELDKLAPNMRRVLDCPRERVPLVVELTLDGELVFEDVVPPSGLRKDGPSNVYARFPVPAGRHVITARMRDSRRAEGYDYETTKDLSLEPREVVVVGFDRERGRFRFVY